LSQIDNLLAVHEVDVQIFGVKKEIADIPVRKKEEETRISTHRQAVEKAESELKLGQASAKEQELEIDSLKDKIIKLRQQQFQIKTNEEFKAIEKEVAVIESKIRGVEDQELDIMETIEGLKKGVTENQESLKKEQWSLDADLKEFDRRAQELEQELARLKSRRNEIASKVDHAWLSAYNRVVERKSDALVPLNQGVCGGCHLKLAPSLGHAVLKQTEPVICDFCGRLLYQG